MIAQKILHYKITEKLGEGGMGVVYKAEDTKLKRDVALKFLPTNMLQSEAEKERFVREAQAAAALSHANIAHIYAIEEMDGQIFIAMEYIEGKSLHDIVGVQNLMPLQDAFDYAIQIAAGLQAAHEKGIVHRDIKSANIMVTGQLPFKGDYEQVMIYAILNEDLEPMTALRSGLHIALDGIIAKALAKDPAMRYQHVDELPADLKALDTRTISRSRISTTKQPEAASLFAKGSRLPRVVAGSMMLLAVAVFWDNWRANTVSHTLTGVKRAMLPLNQSVIGGLAFNQMAQC